MIGLKFVLYADCRSMEILASLSPAIFAILIGSVGTDGI